MISALSDSIYLNPMGSVDVHGVASQVPFFKGLLDKNRCKDAGGACWHVQERGRAFHDY